MKTHIKSRNHISTPAVAGAVLFALAGAAQAQSNVKTYGLLETGLRYSKHQNAAGDNKLELGDGVLNPSRIGFTGSEDLGGGLKALFTLEAGLLLKNGASNNGAIGLLNNDNAGTQRLFGRTASVGLSGEFGSINLGRQYTTAMMSACVGDPICGGGLVVYSPYLLYTSLRQDNMIAYQTTSGPVTFSAHYTAGEKAGSATDNSGYGVGLGYVDGPLALNGAYQENNLPIIAKAKLFTINAAYSVGPARLMFGYLQNKLTEGAKRKNDLFYGGVVYTASPAWTLTATAHHDKQSDAGGKHLLLVGIADYALSKRTSTFVEADYNKYKDAMRPFGANGPDNQLAITLGIRHRF
jgi:predicted porin